MLKIFSKEDIFKKTVFLRVDLNISLKSKESHFRIERVLPTIKKLQNYKAKIILATHIGRPKFPFQKEFSTRFLKNVLSKKLKTEIIYIPDVIGERVESTIKKSDYGKILLLENLRFYEGELKNSLPFAKNLSKLAQVYVSDAFSVCHRKQASVYSLPKLLPSFAGPLLFSEVKNLYKIKNNPKHPCVVILGGKKVDDKVKSIKGFLKFADYILVNNLAQIEIQKNYPKLSKNKKIIFPLDTNKDLDIGEKTIELFSNHIYKAKSVVWSGPLGKFEDKKYAKGSIAVAKAIIKSKAFSVIGGGQTIEFATKYSFLNKFSFVSTGGGAMLHFLAGNPMPGLKALSEK